MAAGLPLGLDGRRMVVTGGTGFLGAAVVRALLDAGASCDVTWHSDSEGRHLPPASDRLRLHRVDVTDEQEVAALYAGMNDLWASVHLVGAFSAAPVADTSADDFLSMFRTNALTAFLCCREAVRAIRRSVERAAGAGGEGGAGGAGGGGNLRGGRIVNVGARPAVTPVGGMIAYSASKAAVASVTQSLAEEVKAERILVNAVLPSIMDTGANRKAMPAANFDDWPKVEEVARWIAFLASPANALTSGALVPVYGRA